MKFRNRATGSVLEPGSELTRAQMLKHTEQYVPVADNVAAQETPEEKVQAKAKSARK